MNRSAVVNWGDAFLNLQIQCSPSIPFPRNRVSYNKRGQRTISKAEYGGILHKTGVDAQHNVFTGYLLTPSQQDIARHEESTPIQCEKDIIDSIKSIIETNNTESALSAIQHLTPATPAIISTAVSAFAKKNGIKGIRAMEKAAKKRKFWSELSPDDKIFLLFSLLRAYGHVGCVDDVERLFRGAMQAKLLEIPLQNPRHVTMYLHAIHSDIDLVFRRAQQLLHPNSIAPTAAPSPNSHTILQSNERSHQHHTIKKYRYDNRIHSEDFPSRATHRQSGSVFETASFNVLLKACMRAKDATKIDLVLQWMDHAGAQPDDITYSCLIKAHSYANDFERVLQVYENLMAKRADGTANHNTASIVYNRTSSNNSSKNDTFPLSANNAVRPSSLSLSTTSYTPSPGVWGDLLIACGRAKHPETMLMIWREAKNALGGASNVPTNVFNALLTACNAAGMAERTLTEFDDMKAAGAVPCTRTYNLAIKACEAAPGQRLRPDRLVTALVLYLEMQSRGVPADEFTYGGLMELCAEGRQGRIAVQLRDRMLAEDIKPNSIIWTSLMKAMMRSKMVDEALNEFKKMVWGPARLKPSRATFRILITELRECGALCAALRAYEGMRRARFAPNNKDFQELVGAAAEAVLVQDDVELQQQLASMCRITSMEEIDLHGMSSCEARAAVLCVLGMMTTAYRRQTILPAKLTIITGKGGHSEGGKAVLPNTVHRLLVDELHIRVPIDINGKNPGRIVVDSNELERWLKLRTGGC